MGIRSRKILDAGRPVVILAILWLLAAPLQASNPGAWWATTRGNAAYAAKTYLEAMAYYARAANQDTASGIPDFNNGAVLFRQGQYAEAEKAYLNALPRMAGRDRAEVSYNLGNTAWRNNATDLAKHYYQQALVQSPDFQPAKHNLELLLRKSAQANSAKPKESNGSKSAQSKPGPPSKTGPPSPSEKPGQAGRETSGNENQGGGTPSPDARAQNPTTGKTGNQSQVLQQLQSFEDLEREARQHYWQRQVQSARPQTGQDW